MPSCISEVMIDSISVLRSYLVLPSIYHCNQSLGFSPSLHLNRFLQRKAFAKNEEGSLISQWATINILIDLFHLLRKKYHRHLQCLKRFPSLLFDQQLLLLLRNLTLFLYRRDLHFHLDSIRQLVISVNDVSKDSIIYKTINVK